MNQTIGWRACSQFTFGKLPSVPGERKARKLSEEASWIALLH